MKLGRKGVSTCEWPFPLLREDFAVISLWVSLKGFKPDEDRCRQVSVLEANPAESRWIHGLSSLGVLLGLKITS